MNKLVTFMLATILILPVWNPAAHAAGNGSITLTLDAAKEIEITGPQGKKEIKRVSPSLVTPGEEVIYTLSYTNNGKEMAQDLFITNPIPPHMIYKANSARGENTVIVYSIDGAKSFDKPENLKIRGIDGKERSATPVNYSHIRWVIKKPLAPGEKGDVSFRAQLQ
ncbi:MAG: hypothetical protein ACOY4D_01780 [Pseudomonadota bacterium]